MAANDDPHLIRLTALPTARPSASVPARRSSGSRRGPGAPRLTDTLPVWLRRVRVEVLLGAFRDARPVDPTALTAVLGAKHLRSEEPFFQWSRHTVRELLWIEVEAWWRAVTGAAAPPPRTTAVTMWTLLDHLDATGELAAGSDPLALLREPLVDSGGLDASGRQLTRPRRGRHPSLSHAR